MTYRRVIHGILALYVALMALWHMSRLFNTHLPFPPSYHHSLFLGIVGFRVAVLLAQDR